MGFACSLEDFLQTCDPPERSSVEGEDGFEPLGSRGISSLELLCFRAHEGRKELSVAEAKALSKHSTADHVLLLVAMGEGRGVLHWERRDASGRGPALRRFRHTREREVCGVCLLLLETNSESVRLRLLAEVFGGAWAFRHKSLLSQHYLCKSLPKRLGEGRLGEERWRAASEHGACVLARLDDLAKQGEGQRETRSAGEALLQALGYTPPRALPSDTRSGARKGVIRLSDEQGVERALAIVLEGEDSPDVLVTSLGRVPNKALSEALQDAREHLDWGFIVYRGRVRLYRKDWMKADRYLECDTRLLPLLAGGEQREREWEQEPPLETLQACLWLLFAAESLVEEKQQDLELEVCFLDRLLSESGQFIEGVAKRLRERIYDRVIPRLATCLAEAQSTERGDLFSREVLDRTYQWAIRVLFRLLFVAYAEDKRFLPSENELYAKRSLKKTAEELGKILRKHGSTDSAFATSSTKYWTEINGLFALVDRGDFSVGLPAYNGGLFAKMAGEREDVRLNDKQFAPILRDLLVDDGGEGARGAVDFADISVRELGTIYEGLLESELSHTDEDLVVDSKSLYRPKTARDKAEDIKVEAGQVYLHDSSGARKSSGSYYTPELGVQHLIERGLKPALQEHFQRIEERLAKEKTCSVESFFDFRVADIAMGSGHFLVAAIDCMAQAFYDYYREHETQLDAVQKDLQQLREAAKDALEKVSAPEREIEESELLRRQIARRCVYGVDRNELAVHLARVSLWMHTFVPGLPLSFLDRTLVHGDSLIGIGTMEEITEKIRGEGSLFSESGKEFLADAEDSLQALSANRETSVQQVKEAQQHAEEIKRKLQPTEALFDMIIADRLIHYQDKNQRVKRKMLTPHSARLLKEKHNLHKIWEYRKAQERLEGLHVLHFPTAFPEVFLRERSGFDVILGNPPWESLKHEEHKFWIRYIDGYNGRSQREKEAIKTEYKRTRLDLVQLLTKEQAESLRLREILQSGTSSYQDYGFGVGDSDLYKFFSIRFWQLATRIGGRISVVLPRSIIKAKGSEGFRRVIFQQSPEIEITTIENRNRWLFENLDGRFVVVLINFAKGENTEQETKIALRGPYTSQENFDNNLKEVGVTFTPSEALSWSRSTTLPTLPSAASVAVLNRLSRSPRLDYDGSDQWRARPYRELDATNDKGLMDLKSEQCPEGYWPVYKGESFDHWQPDRGKYYAWAKPNPILGMLQKKRERGYNSKSSVFSEFALKYIRNKNTLSCYYARLALRLVTNATNTRTIICALIPPKIFCQHGAPTLLFPRGDERDQTYLLGMLCSRPLDWYARRFVELNMDHHIINNLPIPRPAVDNPLRERVIALAGRLACLDSRFQDWAEKIGVECGALPEREKEEMIVELDAVAAHLYDLSRAQLTHIFETFHIGWDYKPHLEKTLEHFDRWQEKRNRQNP